MNIYSILVLVTIIIISLTIHEMMHAFVGHVLGDNTAADEGRLSLNPLRHIDPFMTVILPIISIITFGVPILAAKPVPFDPRNVKWDEFGGALIAAAGPFSNLLLAIIGGILAHFVVGSTIAYDVLGSFVTVNISLFVFNLIPIPPLDGSRVLYAFAPDSLRRVMEQFEPYGLFLIFGLILIRGFSFVSTLINIVLHALPLSPFN
jgi:Zn-dependent protease